MEELQSDSTETQSLLEQVREGDRQSFDQLFARHRAYLCQIVELRLDPRVRTRLDPSDVVQEAHLEAFRRFGAYLRQRPMPFRLWLRQIAYDRTLKGTPASPRHSATSCRERSIATGAVVLSVGPAARHRANVWTAATWRSGFDRPWPSCRRPTAK